jgi:hypothetical protein
MAINVMEKERPKGFLRGKFKRVGWDEGYRYRLLEAF